MNVVDVAAVGVDRLVPLFKPDIPNRALLYSVLEGQNKAVVVVDDMENPSSCALRTMAFGFTFFATQDTRFLAEAITALRQEGGLEVIVPQATTEVELPADVDARIQRIEFLDREVVDSDLPALPSGTQIRPIDDELFERCEWRNEFNGTCNSPEAFCNGAPGICLMRGDDILCEAYAAWWGSGIAEIGAVTAEQHRRQGYGALTCEHLARSCESLGVRTSWTCDDDNAGSVAVARRLGFRAERPYELLVYKQRA